MSLYVSYVSHKMTGGGASTGHSTGPSPASDGGGVRPVPTKNRNVRQNSAWSVSQKRGGGVGWNPPTPPSDGPVPRASF